VLFERGEEVVDAADRGPEDAGDPVAR